MIEGGYKNSAVMQKFDIAERTVLKLKKDGPQIIKDAERNSLTLNTKSVRPAKFPAVDDEVLRFIDLARSAKTPITLDAIMKRALLVKAAILEHSTLSEVERSRLQAFTASKGWVLNFIRRHGLRSVALRGSDASANVVAEKNDLAEVQKRLNEYDLRHIYNVDETSLFFKVLPRPSYVQMAEGKKTLVGCRHMDVGDRITAYLCCNADGTERASVAVIGKSRNPRCFKTGRVPEGMEYYSNKTARANGPTLRSWFNGVFLPFVRSRTDQKVALLVDYVSLHGDLKDGRGQVEVIPLPPNITAVHQPMDMGITQKWKREYRMRMLAAIANDVGTIEERRFLNEANPVGTNGIAEGFEPHLLDVMRLGKEAWDFLPQIVLAKGWERAGILPPGKNTAGLPDIVEENDAAKVVLMIAGLRNGLKEDDPLRAELMVETDEELVRRWFNVEDDVDIRNAMVADALEQMKRPTPKIEVKEEDSDVEMIPTTLPSLQMLYDAFRPAQHLAVKCNLPDATHCIKLAIQCVRDAITKSNCAKEIEGVKMEDKRTTPRKRGKKELSPVGGIRKPLPERVRSNGMNAQLSGVKVDVPKLPTNSGAVSNQGATGISMAMVGTPQFNSTQIGMLKEVTPLAGGLLTGVSQKQPEASMTEQVELNAGFESAGVTVEMEMRTLPAVVHGNSRPMDVGDGTVKISPPKPVMEVTNESTAQVQIPSAPTEADNGEVSNGMQVNPVMPLTSTPAQNTESRGKENRPT